MSLLVAALGSLLLLYSPTAVQARTTQQLLQSRLDEFLAAAGRHGVAVFKRFCADDLVYTRATGETTSKAEILANVRAARGEGAGRTAGDEPALTLGVSGASTGRVGFHQLVPEVGMGRAGQDEVM